MNNSKLNILLVLVFGILVASMYAAFAVKNAPTNTVGGQVISAINTWQSGTTNSTSSINTTSTQVLASITKWARITNPTTATITCSLDDLGTTAASSTVATNKGIVLGPQQASTTAITLPAYVDLGECNTGDSNCIPFKGTVNCLASAAATVSVVKK